MRERSSSGKALTPGEVRDEDVDVTFIVWLTSRATTDLLDSVLRPAGLDGDEFAIYSVLSAASSITPTELARWMAAPPTTVSSYVKRFESRGHVKREPNADDRRSYRIRLTPAGARAHRAASKLFVPWRDSVEKALGPRSSEVRDALLTLREVVDQVRHSPPDPGR